MMNRPKQNAGFGNNTSNFFTVLAFLGIALSPVCAVAQEHASTLQGSNEVAAISINNHDTVSCRLHVGDSTFVIALPQSALLDRLTFINENGEAQGELHIAVSNFRLPPNSSKWMPVDGSVRFAHKRLFKLSMLGVEAKYVRLSFHVENAGRIAALGLRGTETPEKSPQGGHVLRISNPIPSGSGNDGLTFGLAELYASSRIVYISSGAPGFAPRMIDENPETAFRFSATDPHPTVVVELTAEERSHRVTVLYKIGCGHLEAFLLKDYKPSTGHVDLTGLKPVGAVSERAGNGRAIMTIDPQENPFVALRWIPDVSRCGAETFEVAEIGTFSDRTLAMIDPVELASVNNVPSGGPPGEIPIVPAPSP
jgi:hypothetical protein